MLPLHPGFAGRMPTYAGRTAFLALDARDNFFRRCSNRGEPRK